MNQKERYRLRNIILTPNCCKNTWNQALIITNNLLCKDLY